MYSTHASCQRIRSFVCSDMGGAGSALMASFNQNETKDEPRRIILNRPERRSGTCIATNSL
jgi:hypothetical protein